MTNIEFAIWAKTNLYSSAYVSSINDETKIIALGVSKNDTNIWEQAYIQIAGDSTFEIDEPNKLIIVDNNIAIKYTEKTND